MEAAKCRKCGSEAKSHAEVVFGDKEWFTYCPKCRADEPVGHGLYKQDSIECWNWFHEGRKYADNDTTLQSMQQ